MASASGSRTGLIAAVVVLVIVSVTAVVFAIVFYSDAGKKTKEIADLTTAYNDVVRRNALSGPAVVALRERRNSEPFTKSDQLLDVAVRERDDLSRLVRGDNAEAATASAKAALQGAAEAMKAAGLPEPSTTENMADAIRALSGAVTSLNQRVGELNTATGNANKEAEGAKAQLAAQLAERDKQIEALRTEVTGIKDAASTRDRERQGVVDQINAGIEQQMRTIADQKQKMETELADERRKVARLEREVATSNARLAAFRPDTKQSTVRRSDTSIIRVADSNTVFIELGAGNQIVPGMTFEVYDKVSGVPALANDDTTMPTGKASIEVLEVASNWSKARVVKTRPGTTITEGDVVANLIYDRNTKLNFVIYGKFDISGTGKATAEDSAVFRRLVQEWGGSLQGKIDPTTDFLVIGKEPVVPLFTEEERRDPINAEVIRQAEAELDAYNTVLNEAAKLFIPVLNQNRFLYYVGYYDTARR
jgi:hypothetical protein